VALRLGPLQLRDDLLLGSACAGSCARRAEVGAEDKRGVSLNLDLSRAEQTRFSTMKKPTPRALPPRASDNDKRRLNQMPDQAAITRLLQTATYRGISRHKGNPRQFGLPPNNRPRGDETLCDVHANFQPADMATVPTLLRRGLTAGLIGEVETQGIPTMIWTVADDGWIFEARITNAGRPDYHGYPVRASEAIAKIVYDRFADWANQHGGGREIAAADACRALYGLR